MNVSNKILANTWVRINWQQGFTLIEVLVATLVLSIGLLGVAGVQTVGFKNTYDAYLRSQVTRFANDMSDRMRANPVAVTNGNYHNPLGATTQDTDCTEANSTYFTGCTPANLAGQDMFEWSNSINPSSIPNVLPQGAGIVCIDSTPNDGLPAAPACDAVGNLFAIKVWWEDDSDPATALQRFVTSFQP